jgi:hypothetical protein
MTVRRRRRATPTAPIALSDVIEPATTGPKPSGQTPSGSGGEQSSPAKRRRRSKVGGFGLKLHAPSRDGQKRRWVNDDGNRIAELTELGYEFVSETGIQTADPGSRVTRLVGTKANGEPLHAYLMETPDELYAQGESEKEAVNRQIDEAITAGRDLEGRVENQYGHGSITSGR